MPVEYSSNRKAFFEGDKRLPYQLVRSEIDSLVSEVKDQAKSLAARAWNKEITPRVFESEMQDLLRSAHVAAASVGRGGLKRMTQRDWRRVGTKLEWQFGFLKKFSRKIGTLSQAQAQSRAQLYAASVYISFAVSYHRTQIENAL